MTKPEKLFEYFNEHGLKTAVVGLSGGIDSSVVACVAAEALGPQNVVGVSMPSPVSSRHSVDDARELAKRTGIRFQMVPIAKPLAAFRKLLKLTKHDVAVENLQARCRGVILMGIANKLGDAMVLNTGNKSEAMVGYCTLYGDTVGGVSVIGDLYKHQVYELADEINDAYNWIPQSVIDKAPSAELSPGQTDARDLPKYEVLDPMLAQIERGATEEDLEAMGFFDADIERVCALIKRNAFKRHQLPPGL